MANINSLENTNVKFPDVGFYDMRKPGEMALYIAHRDFYPFKSVIENNKASTELITKTYFDIAKKAREIDDFQTETWAMNSAMLQSCRVEVLTQYSLLLVMVSLLEEAVNTLCRIYRMNLSLEKGLKDIKGSGLERAANYLKKEVKINGFKEDKQWEYITTIRDCRNMVVHNGGRIIKEEDRKKCDKFNISYGEKDYQLYIGYKNIEKFYNAMLEFMDRTFRIESDLSGKC